MRTIKIKIPIYFGSLVVIYTKNLKKVFKKHNLQGNHKTISALVFRKQTKKGTTKYYAVFTNIDKSVIAHESVHVVNHIFEDRYIQLDLSNDEPQAYLTGWVFGKILKSLKKLKNG